jgi:hypothetical protein
MPRQLAWIRLAERWRSPPLPLRERPSAPFAAKTAAAARWRTTDSPPPTGRIQARVRPAPYACARRATILSSAAASRASSSVARSRGASIGGRSFRQSLRLARGVSRRAMGSPTVSLLGIPLTLRRSGSRGGLPVRRRRATVPNSPMSHRELVNYSTLSIQGAQAPGGQRYIFALGHSLAPSLPRDC